MSIQNLLLSIYASEQGMHTILVSLIRSSSQSMYL
jgi:hypothetical protein